MGVAKGIDGWDKLRYLDGGIQSQEGTPPTEYRLTLPLLSIEYHLHFKLYFHTLSHFTFLYNHHKSNLMQS